MRVYARYFGEPALRSKSFFAWGLVSELEKNGVVFSEMKDADEFWAFDLGFTDLLVMSRWPKDKRKLVVFEPRAVNPLQHNEWVRARFSYTYVFSESQRGQVGQFIEGGGFNPSKILQDISTCVADQSTAPKPIISVAAGDKQSMNVGSLYWLRRDSIQGLLRAGFPVNLAGPFWQSRVSLRIKQLAHSALQTVCSGSLPKIGLARTKNFLKNQDSALFKFYGFVEDEQEFFQNSDIVLVIENDVESLSEKLFSALCSGRWIIYVGPPEAEKFRNVPSIIFAQPTVDSVVAAAQLILTKGQPPKIDLPKVFSERHFEKFNKRLATRLIQDSRIQK